MNSQYGYGCRRYHKRKDEISLERWSYRRSFYNKCGAIQRDGVWILRSYDTLFAAEYNGHLVLISEMPWSVTTRTHVEAFARMTGAEYNGLPWARKHVPIYPVECDDAKAIAGAVKGYLANR